MDLTYIELKEDMKDSFNSLYQNSSYPAKETFYATLNDYQCHDTSTQTEECCIYVNFALILLQHGETINFMKKRLYELIEKKNYNLYEIELKEEFKNLRNDIDTLEIMLTRTGKK